MQFRINYKSTWTNKYIPYKYSLEEVMFQDRNDLQNAKKNYSL